MTDLILKDVKDLLMAGKGDPTILERIKRAAENNEVISVHERGYVAKLVQENLKQEEIEPEKKAIPEPESKIEDSPKIQDVQLERPQITETVSQTKTKIPIKMIGIGIGAAIAIIAIAVGLALSETDLGSSQPIITTPTVNSNLPLSTDESSYNKGDIISISGNSDSSISSDIVLSIQNSQAKIIWSEELKIKDNGSFSTLTIAGGQGWETSGEYTLKAEHGTEESSVTFDFEN